VAKLRITYNAPVILTFTIAAVAAFIAQQAGGAEVQRWFVASPHLGGVRSYVGLVSYILGHASWAHLLGNFMLILLIGPILEERHGSLTLLVMILLTAVIGGLANIAFSSNYLLGASGVAFMMILLASMANVRAGEIPLTLIIIAIVFMGGEVVAQVKGHDNISHLAHLVGGTVGAAFGFLLARPKRVLKKPGDLTKLKLPV
jgi:membrane associated rhomboid family serine protease